MDTKAYFFAGGSFLRYDIEADRVDPGYPLPIAGNWNIPFTSYIDGALWIDANTMYFFKGPQYIRYNPTTDTTVDGPKPIEGSWPGVPFTQGIDAALRWDENVVYFFKDDQYVLFDLVANRVRPNYPQKISANWRGAPFSSGFSGNLGTVIRWNNGKVYFFRGIYYLRYDMATDQMDPGYPRVILENWPGFQGFNILEMKAAFIHTLNPVRGQSQFSTSPAVSGLHDFGGDGVYGESNIGVGVRGVSASNEAVRGQTSSPVMAAIAAYNLNPTGTGAALYGRKAGSVGYAGFFEGNVHVNGNLNLSGQLSFGNADCAEDFDLVAHADAEPGTVMVVGDDQAVEPCLRAYDKRVAGVVSRAGRFQPGILLDQQATTKNRATIGLVGKVCCKVDATHAAIEVGDLLTTSDTPGHAMKASHAGRAFGAVLGKALSPLPSGKGLIPILIALQ